MNVKLKKTVIKICPYNCGVRDEAKQDKNMM